MKISFVNKSEKTELAWTGDVCVCERWQMKYQAIPMEGAS